MDSHDLLAVPCQPSSRGSQELNTAAVAAAAAIAGSALPIAAAAAVENSAAFLMARLQPTLLRAIYAMRLVWYHTNMLMYFRNLMSKKS